ncbi:hypothetical protein NQ318_001832 [Aromia moschata]|uniref:Uncharacterized protein n=1 Tax=Aromia moschata TaxID=1265417 RepID=A0AAV8Z103_9CUCU|nr:hypothetical protein NQ318_001832 [Aromia moschata]
MSNTEEKICRLCLTKTKYEYEELVESKKQCFFTLLLEVDISITQRPVMCKRCARNLDNAFEFKNTCLQTEEIIAAFAALSNTTVLDLKEVYLSENTGTDSETDAGSICRFCLKCMKQETCMSLSVLGENMALVKDMLPKCLPELDFGVILAPVICTPCIKSLERYLCFWRTCSEVEQKITKYSQSITPNTTQIKLEDIMQFIEKDLMGTTETYDHPILISIESYDEEMTHAMDIDEGLDELVIINIPNYGSISHKSGDHVKVEGGNETAIEANDLEAEPHENMEVESVFTINLDSPTFEKIANDVKIRDIDTAKVEKDRSKVENGSKDDVELGNYVVPINKDLNDCTVDSEEKRENIEMITNGIITDNDSTSLQTACKGQSGADDGVESISVELEEGVGEEYLVQKKTKDFKSSEEISERYREKNGRLNSQLPKQKEKSDQPKRKKKKRKHSKECSAIENEPSELDNSECKIENPNFSIPTQISEIIVSELNNPCQLCESDIKTSVYKCTKCDFETNLRNIIQYHDITHDKVLKVNAFKCDICHYENKDSVSFNTHLLSHEKSTEDANSMQENDDEDTKPFRNERGVFKCNSCIYKTKSKEKFNSHRKSHMDGTEFKCPLCPFTAKQKNNLAVHSLTHDPKRVYKCNTCTFETRRKDFLQTHFKTHRDRKGTLFKCVLCVFETKVKSCFKRHMEGHNVVTEKPNTVAQDLMIINEGGVLRLDFSLSEEAIMCKFCAATLRTCFDLVSTCQSTRDASLSMKKPVQIGITNGKQYKTCLFCAREVNGDLSRNLKSLEEEIVTLRDSLALVVFELYIAAFEESMLCEFCHNALRIYVDFSKNCLKVERQMLQKYESKELPPANIDHGHKDVVEAENIGRGALNAVKIESCSEIRQHTSKEKEEDLSELDHLDLHTDFKINENECEITTYAKHPSMEVLLYKCPECPFQTSTKRYLTKHSRRHKPLDEIPTFKCDLCPYVTKHKWYLSTHALLHKDVSEVEMYKCQACPYETKNVKSLKRHLFNHDDSLRYACDKCPFVTKQRICLRRHAITHQDPSELVMHKCDMCPYQSRFKKNLKTHLLIHQSASELVMYKCGECPYETKNKQSLTLHSLVHRKKSEVRVYKCEHCSYETKRKCNLYQHTVVHKAASEISMFKCGLCNYERRGRRILSST